MVEKYKDISTIDDFVAKTYYLQFAFAINEQERCLMGLKRVRELYQANFKPEALFEYATVIHTYLNHKLKPCLNNEYKPSFASSINIAYKNNLINSEQKKLLNKLRKYRNIKGHVAGVNFKNNITDMFLNNKLNLIESIILC